MKGLSIKEPFASLIADGRKTIETRTWSTHYRGPLLICASSKPKILGAGLALCIVTLYDVRKMRPEDATAAMCDYCPDRYSWVLINRMCLSPRIPVTGARGLWVVDYDRLVDGWNSNIEARYRELYLEDHHVKSD